VGRWFPPVSPCRGCNGLREERIFCQSTAKETKEKKGVMGIRDMTGTDVPCCMPCFFLFASYLYFSIFYILGRQCSGWQLAWRWSSSGCRFIRAQSTVSVMRGQYDARPTFPACAGTNTLLDDRGACDWTTCSGLHLTVRRRRKLNPWPVDCKSSTLATTPPSNIWQRPAFSFR